MQDNKPTDHELAASVRELFLTLRQAIFAARRAGLRVDYSIERLHELLVEPDFVFFPSDIKIVRPL